MCVCVCFFTGTHVWIVERRTKRKTTHVWLGLRNSKRKTAMLRDPLENGTPVLPPRSLLEADLTVVQSVIHPAGKGNLRIPVGALWKSGGP